MRLQIITLISLVSLISGCGSKGGGGNTTSQNSNELQLDSTPTTNDSQRQVKIVIDRAPHKADGTGQRIKVYENNVLKHTFTISTGRETFDIPPMYSIEPYCSITPKGTFHPTRLREMYYSNTWATSVVVKDASGRPIIDPETNRPRESIVRAEMPYAIFFKDGVAVHGTEHVDELGRPASGACVRVVPKEAKVLFDMIAAKDGDEYVKNDPNQNPDSECSKTNKKPEFCVDREQWPVRPSIDFKNVIVEVVDSRPQQKQDAAATRCQEDRAWYKAANDECFEENAARIAGANVHGQQKRGFFADLFDRGDFFDSPRRELSKDETIAVKKYCRAKLRSALKARRS